MIREACGKDTDRIHEIGCSSYRQNFKAIWSAEGIERHLAAGFSKADIRESLNQCDKNSWYLITDPFQEKYMGFAHLILKQSIPYQQENAAELRKLYLLPEASGQGLGKALINFVIDYAKKIGYKKLWLDVLKSNTGAIRFYQANGFKKVGELPFKTDQREVGQWVMVKIIDPEKV